MGNAAGAKAAVDSAAGIVRSATEPEGMTTLPILIAITYHDLGDDAAAKRSLTESLVTVKKLTDAEARFYAIEQIAMGHAFLRDAAAAKATFAEARLAAPKAGAQALTDLPKAEADLLTQLGDFAGARRVLAGAKADLANQALTFATIAEKQAKAGDKAGAKLSMEEAVRTQAKIKDANYRSFISGLLPAYYVKIGDVAAAKRLAGKSENGLKSVATALAEAGDVAGAKATYAKPTPELALAQAAAGDIAGARKTADAVTAERDYSMQDDPVRLYAAIAAAQAKAGDRTGAAQTLAKARKLATTKDEILGDNSPAMLASLLEALFTGGKRDW